MDIGKLLLVGGIGFVAYEWLFGGAAAAPSTTPATTPATTTPAGSNAGIVSAQTTRQMLTSIAASQNPPFTSGSADEWDVFYAQARGIAAPDPGSYLTPANRNESLTLSEYCSASGLCGIVPMSGGMSGYRPTDRLWVMEAE